MAHVVEELAALLDEHTCAPNGECTRRSHTQLVLVGPAEVQSTSEQIRLLLGIRDLLTARGLSMLETEPLPRFEAGENEPKPWKVRYTQAWATNVTPTLKPRGGWLRELLRRW